MDVGQERGGDQHDKWLRTRSKPSELPNEIFGLILCLVQRNVWINPAPLPAEVTLSHVCRHWRRFTLALPSLWSVFRYDGSHFATHRERVPVKRLAVYLERSKQHPVELFFDLDHFQEDHLGDWTDVLSMVEQIIPHLQRVRELHVLSFKDKIDKFLSKLVDASAPLLEALTIRGEWQPELMESADSKWSPQIFTGGTPSLKYLRFDDKPFSQPPIQSIVHLRLEEVPEMESLEEEFSPSMLRELLSLPYLETFSIWGTFVTVPLEMVVASMPKMESKTEAFQVRWWLAATGPVFPFTRLRPVSGNFDVPLIRLRRLPTILDRNNWVSFAPYVVSSVSRNSRHTPTYPLVMGLDDHHSKYQETRPLSLSPRRPPQRILGRPLWLEPRT